MANISQVEVNGTIYDICDATVKNGLGRNDAGNIHFRTGVKNGVYKEYSFEPTGVLYAKIFNEDGTVPDNSAGRPVAQLNVVEDNDHQSIALYTSHNTQGTTYRGMFTEYGNLRKDYSTDSGATGTTMQYYPHTEKGSVTVTAPKQAYTDQAVTFSRVFDFAPTVLCNFNGPSTSYQMGNVSCSAINVSTTGFTVRVGNADTTNREPSISGIAVQ